MLYLKNLKLKSLEKKNSNNQDFSNVNITDKEREIILAEAFAKSEQIKGQGDKKATKIYSESYSKDPSFYEFLRKLDSYEKIIDENSIIFFVVFYIRGILQRIKNPPGIQICIHLISFLQVSFYQHR